MNKTRHLAVILSLLSVCFLCSCFVAVKSTKQAQQVNAPQAIGENGIEQPCPEAPRSEEEILRDNISQSINQLQSTPNELIQWLPGVTDYIQDGLSESAFGVLSFHFGYDEVKAKNIMRYKRMFLVYICLNPFKRIDDPQLKVRMKTLTVNALQADTVHSIAYDWLDPALGELFLLLPKDERTFLLEYITYANQSLEQPDFYEQELAHWQASSNKRTKKYNHLYFGEMVKYDGTSAYEYILNDPFGNPAGPFRKLDMFLFRRIHFDHIPVENLKELGLSVETTIRQSMGVPLGPHEVVGDVVFSSN